MFTNSYALNCIYKNRRKYIKMYDELWLGLMTRLQQPTNKCTIDRVAQNFFSFLVMASAEKLGKDVSSFLNFFIILSQVLLLPQRARNF